MQRPAQITATCALTLSATTIFIGMWATMDGPAEARMWAIVCGLFALGTWDAFLRLWPGEKQHPVPRPRADNADDSFESIVENLRYRPPGE